MKANKGFTLLEVAVVLAIIAILAAIMTPIVTSYVDQARVTRANNDVKKIAQAVLLFKRDTGVYPGFSSYYFAGFSTSQGTASCLSSGTSFPPSVNGWACTNYASFETSLNVNSYALGTVGVSEATGGRAAYRGPYIDGLAGLDPWGTPYLVNSGNFAVQLGYRSFAISAGPNLVFDTTKDQSKSSGFAVAGDDIVSLIQ